MSVVEAIYAGGAFRPLGAIDMQENQRVRLTVELADPLTAPDWLAATAAFRDHCLATYGVLPDSTTDIAADRRRDG